MTLPLDERVHYEIELLKHPSIAEVDAYDGKCTDNNPDHIPNPEKCNQYVSLKNPIDLKRKNTPKIVIYSKNVKCTMMYNFPDPLFEVVFSEGYTIIKDGTQLYKVQMDNKQTVTEESLDETSLFWLREMVMQCEFRDRYMAHFAQNDADVELYPMIFGDEEAFNLSLHSKNTTVCNYKSGEIKQLDEETDNEAAMKTVYFSDALQGLEAVKTYLMQQSLFLPCS